MKKRIPLNQIEVRKKIAESGTCINFMGYTDYDSEEAVMFCGVDTLSNRFIVITKHDVIMLSDKCFIEYEEEKKFTLKVEILGTIWQRTTFERITKEQKDDFLRKLKNREITHFEDFRIKGVEYEDETLYDTFEEISQEQNKGEAVLWVKVDDEEGDYFFTGDKDV